MLRREHTPAAWGYVRRKRHFDDQGRLMVEELLFEPVEDGKFEARSSKLEISAKFEGEK